MEFGRMNIVCFKYFCTFRETIVRAWHQWDLTDICPLTTVIFHVFGKTDCVRWQQFFPFSNDKVNNHFTISAPYILIATLIIRQCFLTINTAGTLWFYFHIEGGEIMKKIKDFNYQNESNYSLLQLKILNNWLQNEGYDCILKWPLKNKC